MLDTVGAFTGPLLATGLMLAWANDFRAVFWVAVIPGVLAVLLLLVGIREPEQRRERGAVNPMRRAALARLGRPYWWMLGLGVALWGVHMGMTQGLLAAMVADTAPEDLRGTAFGFFNLMSGIALLVSSVVAGLLWELCGSSVTFMVGAGFAAITLLGIVLQPVTARRHSGP